MLGCKLALYARPRIAKTGIALAKIRRSSVTKLCVIFFNIKELCLSKKSSRNFVLLSSPNNDQF